MWKTYYAKQYRYAGLSSIFFVIFPECNPRTGGCMPREATGRWKAVQNAEAKLHAKESLYKPMTRNIIIM
jgi:hypothetical protein